MLPNFGDVTRTGVFNMVGMAVDAIHKGGTKLQEDTYAQEKCPEIWATFIPWYHLAIIKYHIHLRAATIPCLYEVHGRR